MFCSIFQNFSFDGSRLVFSCKVKVSLNVNLMAHHAGAYSGFCSMKWLGVFLLPSGWDASPSQGYPQHNVCRYQEHITCSCWYSLIHLGGEKHCDSKVSCPRTQHNVPDQGSNPDRSIQLVVTRLPSMLQKLYQTNAQTLVSKWRPF